MSFLDQVEREAMSNLRSKSTGVDGAILWVSAGEFEGKESQQGPRVKVILGQGRVTMEALQKAPSVKIKDGSLIQGRLKGSLLKKIQMFLDLNRTVLLDYWNQKIDTVQMAQEIKKI